MKMLFGRVLRANEFLNFDEEIIDPLPTEPYQYIQVENELNII